MEGRERKRVENYMYNLVLFNSIHVHSIALTKLQFTCRVHVKMHFDEALHAIAPRIIYSDLKSDRTVKHVSAQLTGL